MADKQQMKTKDRKCSIEQGCVCSWIAHTLDIILIQFMTYVFNLNWYNENICCKNKDSSFLLFYFWAILGAEILPS